MAAYAALVSLMNLMKDINNHPRFSTSLHTNQIESLGQSVRFLLDFVESYRCDGGSKEAVEDLERQIASAAHGAEDAIESHVVDQILDGSSQNSGGSLLDLQNEILAMNLVKENVFRFEEERMLNEKKEKVEEERGHKPKRPKYSTPSASSSTHLTNAMEGVADESKQLMDALIGTQSSRQIISIVGMGGTGKTTLTQSVYEDYAIVQRFDFRRWVTISQEHNERDILLRLVSQIARFTCESFEELGENLYQSLFRRRYLIVLDDMWSAQVWDKIKRFFPDNGNDSRVVVTTRLSNMETSSLSSFIIMMKLLDEHTSWKLFCQNAFGQEDCPLELEELGLTIVKKCKGLPLPILVIGGHLGKASRAKRYWESVADDMNSILDSEGDEQCLDILSLSYTYLPVHLKPCFLYMGFYQEDKEIFVPELIRCWVAEGFVKPNDVKNMEGVAYDHLKELTDRDLIVAHRKSCNGRIAHVKIHDLVREMCMKVGKKEMFFGVLDSTPRAMHTERRVVFNEEIPEEEHQPEIIHALRSAPLLRTLKCEGGELPFAIKLLKVLNRFFVAANGGTLEDRFPQVNLRYLDYYVPSDDESSPEVDDEAICLPPSISQLWNLQTLIILGSLISAPSEIWNMLQLRHLEFSSVRLPDPLPNEGDIVLLNLQTIRGVVNFKMSEEVCSRIPNIKELDMKYYNDLPKECEEEETSSYYCPHNLGRFHKLESLQISFLGAEIKEWYSFARSLTFPNSLHQLSVTNSPLCWEDMTMIGQIPHLEDLTMVCSATGRHWDSVEGEFRNLKSLRIFSCGSLVGWIAEKSHFPKLENLTIGGSRSLVEIPSDIGEIPTLRSIALQWCSISAAVSAARMVKGYANKEILLQVKFQDPADAESFRKVVGEECFNCNNIRVLRY